MEYIKLWENGTHVNANRSFTDENEEKTPIAEQIHKSVGNELFGSFSPATSFDQFKNQICQTSFTGPPTPINCKPSTCSNSSTPRTNKTDQVTVETPLSSNAGVSFESSATSGICSGLEELDPLQLQTMQRMTSGNARTANCWQTTNCQQQLGSAERMSQVHLLQDQQRQFQQQLQLQPQPFQQFTSSSATDPGYEEAETVRLDTKSVQAAFEQSVGGLSEAERSIRAQETLNQLLMHFLMHGTLEQKVHDQSVPVSQDLVDINNTTMELLSLLATQQSAQQMLPQNILQNALRQSQVSSSSVSGVADTFNSLGPLNNLDFNQSPSTATVDTLPSSMLTDIGQMARVYQSGMKGPEQEIERLAYAYRNSATQGRTESAAQWTGNVTKCLPPNVVFSRKVFLGGVPWDITTEELVQVFGIYGDVTVHWPDRHATNLSQKSQPKGYCYVVFDSEESVKYLMERCPVRNEGHYYPLLPTSKNARNNKDVQVIPWVVSDSTYARRQNVRVDPKRTVFVGALHGMITAETLFIIMDTLFHHVVLAALDTDKFKYPIGSGRVVFDSQQSYIRAVTTNFVDVKTSKFSKTIQIDPYLEDSTCNNCFHKPGIYFCRAFSCFRYFCPTCWTMWHNKGQMTNHKPLRRSFKSVTPIN